jgi:MHS family proline/betaine transporter-like MFS transporter
MSHSLDAHHNAQTAHTDQRRQRKAVVAAGLGTAIEYFDFTIYAFLATSIATVFFPHEDATAALLSTFAVFGVSFLLRPLGGVLTGHLADRYGRRRALTLAVVGMAGASFAIGVVPGYGSIGIAATILLVLMRSIQGLSAGGELGTAASYLAEESPIPQRGYRTSFVNIGTLAGTVLGSLFVAIIKACLTSEQITAWGWRIPFLLSLPLGVIALVIRRRMEESSQFETIREKHGVVRAPLRSLVTAHPRALLSVTLLALTSNASYWVVFTYLGSYFDTQKVMSAAGSAWATTGTLVLAALALPLWARVSDRIGRRPVMIGTNALFVVLSYPAFVLMSHSTVMAIVTQLVMGQLTSLYLASILATFAEMFPAGVRVSGFAFGYNIAAVLAGGTAPYVATWLIEVTGNRYSPAFFLMVATALALVGAVFTMKETANKPLPLD